ncbi:MAG: amidophosphoribosyltransferase [Nitrospinota bacterium]
MYPEIDKLQDKCAVMAVCNHKDAANLTYLGLYSLQHRGQESSGIVSSDSKNHYAEIGMGLVSEVFNSTNLDKLKGEMAIGHNRYSTHGTSELRNSLPLFIEYAHGPLALSHNGNLVNAVSLRKELEKDGSIFRSTVDSEVVLHLIAKSQKETLADKVVDALSQTKGAYSLVIMSASELIVARDPNGFRPLVIGKVDDAFIFASETCAFDLIGAKFIREVQPGELIVVNESGLHSLFPFQPAGKKECIFELIYFARPDSFIFDRNVYSVRKALGAQLAKESYVDADLVAPVPDSGVVAALGYAQASNIPYEKAIIRNHYVGRTFIEPSSSIRNFGIKIKLNPIKSLIKNKKVVLVDDSIVRGTTSRKLIKMVREAGAKEIHFRISSPPTTHPCYYGIDTPNRTELIAATYSEDEIAKYLEVDSLAYLSFDKMFEAVQGTSTDFCHACFSGDYPVAINKTDSQLELVEASKSVKSPT